MAHFAKLDENNIVLKVHRVGNDIATSEQTGIDYLQKLMRVKSIPMMKAEMLLLHQNHLIHGH